MPAFDFSSLFSSPYFEGGPTSEEAQYLLDVALGGHPYMIDWTSEIPLRHVSIPILRQQQDTSESPGEQSINSEALWRRFAESWHVGAGQERFDRKESNQFRFRESRGINIWDQWQITLLHDTFLAYDDAATNQRMAVAGNRLYFTQGTSIKYTTDLDGAETDITGEPATAPTSIASNGFRVWTVHGTDGIYMTNRTIGTTASHITAGGVTLTLIAYVKNRVLAASAGSIYDVTALAVGGGGALPAAHFTHGNTDWSWVGFAESQGFIYVAGFSGDKSLIYSIGITAEGSALGAPTVAGALPDGEVVSSVSGYLGRFLAIGSNKGFRLALVSEGGGLNIGALIETPAAVKCFEGQEEFIWYGLTNFDGVNGGLGRMSTNQFSDLDKLVPAYASDLMAPSTDEVQDVVTFDGRRVFTISGQGVFVEHETNLVENGYIDSGLIGFGITDPKTALYVDMQIMGMEDSDSSLQIYFSTDQGTFIPLALHTMATCTTVQVGEAVGNEFELRIVISRDSMDETMAISLMSWLLRAQPKPLVTNMIYATVFLAPTVETLVDVPHEYDSMAELAYIEQLNLSKAIIPFLHSRTTYSVIVEDYEMNVKRLIDEPDGSNGINASCTLKLKRV